MFAGVTSNLRAGTVEATGDVASTSAARAPATLQLAEPAAGLPQRASGTLATSERLDEVEELTVDMPPLLLLMATKLMEVDHEKMPGTPMLAHCADQWPDRERTDITTLVMRLWLLAKVFNQQTVALSQLLGGIAVGAHEVTLRVPDRRYQLRPSTKLTPVQFAAQQTAVMVSADAPWAFIGPGNAGVDSWMYLRTHPVGQIFSVQVQSKKRTQPKPLTVSAVAREASKVVRPRTLRHVLLFVTDQPQPRQGRRFLDFVAHRAQDSVLLITPDLHPAFYSNSGNLLKVAMAQGDVADRDTAARERVR